MIKLKPGQVLEEFETHGKKIVFRIPRKGDEKACLYHINSLIRDRSFIYWQKRFTLNQEKKWLEEQLGGIKRGIRITVVVEADGEIIGNASVWKEPYHAKRHSANLGLGLSAQRGIGIGSRLMKTLETLAVSNLKVKMLELSVYEPNVRAIGLYKNSGFREVGRIPKGLNHYGRYLDEIIMVKDL